jgi:hypothetical protein
VTSKRTLSGKSSVGTLTSQLRVPANDRLQKIHNTGIALAKLRADGAIPAHTSSNGVTAKDIVDGHQVDTAMITTSIFKFNVLFELHFYWHTCAQRVLIMLVSP